MGYIWAFLKGQFPLEFTDKIKGMKKFIDNRGAAFDVPVEQKDLIDEYI